MSKPVPDNCHRCDKPHATPADFDACPGGCECDRCLSLCWRAYGGLCEEHNWRAEALALRAKVADLMTIEEPSP
jgi:hypothetical protein